MSNTVQQQSSAPAPAPAPAPALDLPADRSVGTALALRDYAEIGFKSIVAVAAGVSIYKNLKGDKEATK